MVLTDYQKKEIDEFFKNFKNSNKNIDDKNVQYENQYKLETISVNDDGRLTGISTMNPKKIGKFLVDLHSYLENRPDDQKILLNLISQRDDLNFLKKMSSEFKKFIENQKAQQNPKILLTDYQKETINKILKDNKSNPLELFSLSVNKEENQMNNFYPNKSTADFFMEVYYGYLKDRPDDQKVFLDKILQIDQYNLEKITKNSPEFKKFIENQKAQQNPETNLTSSGQAQVAVQENQEPSK